MTGGLCCIVPQEMALVRMTFIQGAMVIPTLFKAKDSSYVFGGFTTVDWDCSGDYKSDPNAFIFSLTNKDKRPIKIKMNPNKHQSAIHCHSSIGPTLGNTYSQPQYAYITNEAQKFLAGSQEFQLDEIEVYQKEE